MGNPASIVEELFEALPTLRSQMYFKTSLTALSHAMEDQVLAGADQPPLIIASFQQERFYRQEAHRYERIGQLSDQVYVLSAAETKFSETVDGYEKISFDSEDALTEEWHLVVVGKHYSACAHLSGAFLGGMPTKRWLTHPCRLPSPLHLDQTRRFEGILDIEPAGGACARLMRLLSRIQVYRPDLAEKIGWCSG